MSPVVTTRNVQIVPRVCWRQTHPQHTHTHARTHVTSTVLSLTYRNVREWRFSRILSLPHCPFTEPEPDHHRGYLLSESVQASYPIEISRNSGCRAMVQGSVRNCWLWVFLCLLESQEGVVWEEVQANNFKKHPRPSHTARFRPGEEPELRAGAMAHPSCVLICFIFLSLLSWRIIQYYWL